MRRSILAIVLLSASLSLKADCHPNDILGIWLMANKNVKVEMYKTNGEYFGRVVWMDVDADKRNFEVGDIIIDNMKYDPDTKKYEGGNFYGRGYKLGCELRLVERDLVEVRVSKGFLYQIRYCTRIS